MEKDTRLRKIVEIIESSSSPISASNLGKMLNVSRQLIVGDVALLRASGINIFATPRGYLLEKDRGNDYIATIACVHKEGQMQEELEIIIDEGGEVLDVIVSHPIYGDIKGNLHIATRYDIGVFLEKLEQNKASLLSTLSNGVHLHTIKCKDELMYNRIINKLKQAKLLYL